MHLYWGTTARWASNLLQVLAPLFQAFFALVSFALLCLPEATFRNAEGDRRTKAFISADLAIQEGASKQAGKR